MGTDLPPCRPSGKAPKPTGRSTAACTDRLAVERRTGLILPRPIWENCNTAAMAFSNSGWTGTIRLRPPFPWRTLMVGWSESSDRSAASWARGSDTRSPARHWSSINKRERGLEAAANTAWTWCASRYSGAVKLFVWGLCCTCRFLACVPLFLGRMEVVMAVAM